MRTWVRDSLCVSLSMCIFDPREPGSDQITCQGLTSPTPQPIIHRGQLGSAPRLQRSVISTSFAFSPHLSFFLSYTHISSSYTKLKMNMVSIKSAYFMCNLESNHRKNLSNLHLGCYFWTPWLYYCFAKLGTTHYLWLTVIYSLHMLVVAVRFWYWSFLHIHSQGAVIATLFNYS